MSTDAAAGLANAERLAAFRGAVSCRRSDCSPLALTLIGEAADRENETLYFSFAASGAATAAVLREMPDTLRDAIVAQAAPDRYRISAAGREWHVTAAAAFAHRDVGRNFRAAVPPAWAPLSKRLFWRAALVLARLPLARRVLLGRRGATS